MTPEKRTQLESELSSLFNRMSIDNFCNTPDWLLAEHVVNYLFLLSDLNDRRYKWGTHVDLYHPEAAAKKEEE